MRNTLFFILLCSLPGCGLLEDASIPEVEFDTVRSSYAPGDEVKLVLVNFSLRTYIVHPDLCGTVLYEQRPSGSWHRAEDQETGVCTSVGRALKPKTKMSSRTHLSETLPAGRYRYGYEINSHHEAGRSILTERMQVFTKDFEVTPGESD